jgi:hypothetical protein
MVGSDTLSDLAPERPADSPVDMASLEAAQDEKRRLLDTAGRRRHRGRRRADAPLLRR